MKELFTENDDLQESTGCKLNPNLSKCTSGYGNLRTDCSTCKNVPNSSIKCSCFVRSSAVNDVRLCSDTEKQQRYAVDQICGMIDEGVFKPCDPGCCSPTCAGECCTGSPQTDTNFKFIPTTSDGTDTDDGDDGDDGDEVTDVKTFIPKNVFNFLMFLMTYALIVILILLALK